MPNAILSWGVPLVRVLFWFAVFTGLLPLALVIEQLLPPHANGWSAAFAAITWIMFYVSWPPLCVLLAAAPMAFLWRSPTRITLLRPFGEHHRKGPLGDLASHVLAQFGHTYTLADHQFRLPWYLRARFLGLLRKIGFPSLTVDSAKALDRLVKTLRGRVARNINWLISNHHVFPVRSSDAFWRATVALLVTSSDLLVVDVTAFADGVVDELEHCRREKRLHDVVLVVDPAQVDAARASLATDPELSRCPLLAWPERNAQQGDIRRILEERFGPRRLERQWTRPLAGAFGLAAACVVLVLTYKRMADSFLPSRFPALTVAVVPWAEPVRDVYESSVQGRDNAMAARAHDRLITRFPHALLDYSLEALFESNNYALQQEAAKDIALLGSAQHLPVLRRRLASDFDGGLFELANKNADVLYRTLLASIERLGGDPWPDVVAALAENGGNRWPHAASAIGNDKVHCASETCREPLLLALDNGERSEVAAKAIGVLHECRAISKLFDHIEPAETLNPFTWGSKPFRDALKALSLPECLPEFREFLGDKRELVHQFLLDLLRQHPDHGSVERLLPRIDDPPSLELLEATLSADDTPALVAMLKDSTHRPWAIESLGRIGDERAITPLFREEERKMPTCTFLFFSSPCTNPATIALASARFVPFTKTIEGMLFDTDRSLRRHALGWLERHGDCQVMGSLLRLETPLWQNGGEEAVRQVIARNNECALALADPSTTEGADAARIRVALSAACLEIDGDHVSTFAEHQDPALKKLGRCARDRLAKEAAEKAAFDNWVEKNRVTRSD
jgi:hypothetical protein